MKNEVLSSQIRDRVCLSLVVVITGIFLVLGLLDAPRGFYLSDDSFIYMGMSQIVLQGKTPYTDFFFAHPPGLLLVTVELGRLGMGMAHQSYAFFSIGLSLAVVVAWFARWLGFRGWQTAFMGFLAMESSTLFFTHQSQVMTDIPAALMTVVAVTLATRESRAALCGAAVFLVLAALFRLQSFIALPGLVLLNWTIWGWRRGTVRSVVLVALAVVLHVLVTLGLEARYAGYWNAVYGSHFSRIPISLGLRALRVHEMLKMPEMLLGLIAALWLTVSPNRRLRAVAFVALTTTFLTAFGAKSLYHHYFLLPLPFCSICLAVLVGNWLATPTQRWPVLLCVLLVSGEQLYDCASRVRSGKKLHAEYAQVNYCPASPGENCPGKSPLRRARR